MRAPGPQDSESAKESIFRTVGAWRHTGGTGLQIASPAVHTELLRHRVRHLIVAADNYY